MYLNLFWKGIRQNQNWEIKDGNNIHSNGVILGLQHEYFFIETLFYFIVTLELCVHPII